MALGNDRQLLGAVGLALDDDTYVQVVAGMGLTWTDRSSSARGAQRFPRWLLNNFLIARERIVPGTQLEVLLAFRQTWFHALDSVIGKRVLIDGVRFNRTALDLAAITRILNHPAVGAESVLIETQAPDADLRWQWPLRIAAFADDFEVLHLAHLGQVWPSNSLVEVEPLTRQQARCEILIMPGTVRDALRRILASPYRVRAAHLVLLGPVDITWFDLKPHIETLLTETQATALSLVSLPPSAAVSELLNNWVRELSHNEPYDVALARAFPRQSSFHMADLRLLDRYPRPTT